LETRARAYHHQGDLAGAEAAYRSILDSTDDRLDFPLVYVKALLGMAEVLEAQGRREEAASSYRRFLEHWGGATDPLPGVADARSRLELLEGQP
jgi:tetratricopeptide (TPR) repeat protein